MLTFFQTVLAKEIEIGNEAKGIGFGGIGPLGLIGISPEQAPKVFAQVIGNIIGFMTVIGALWFLFQVIIAGYNWLGAGNDKQKISEAQGKLTYAVVGFGVVALAIVVVRLVATLLNIDIALDPIKVVPLLTP